MNHEQNLGGMADGDESFCILIAILIGMLQVPSNGPSMVSGHLPQISTYKQLAGIRPKISPVRRTAAELNFKTAEQI